MDERLENMGNLFRDDLKNFEAEIPEGVWEKIAMDLPRRKKRTIIPSYMRIAASVAILLSVGILAGYLPRTKNTVSNIAVVKPTEQATKQKTALKTITNHNGQKSSNNSSSIPVKQNNNIESSLTGATKKENTNIAISGITADSSISGTKLTKTNNRGLNELAGTKLKSTNIPGSSITEKDSTGIPVINKDHQNAQLASNDLIFEDYEKEKSKVKWLVGGSAGPQYSYRTITSEYVTNDMLKNMNSNETGVMAYAGGVNVEMKPTRRFSIESGVYYSKIGLEQVATQISQTIFADPAPSAVNAQTSSNLVTTVSYKFPNSSARIVTSSNTKTNGLLNQVVNINNYAAVADVTSPQKIPVWRYYEYLEIPVIAKYSIIDRKIGVHVLGGLSTNILVNNSIYLKDKQTAASSYKTEGVNPYNFSSTVGLGFSYAISSRINLSFEPQFKYFLSSQVNQSNIDIRPYSVGIFSGVKYLF